MVMKTSSIIWKLFRVVPDFDFRGRPPVPGFGPGFLGAGARASIGPAIHSTSRSVSVTPAAIAGEHFSVLWMRQNLYWTANSAHM